MSKAVKLTNSQIEDAYNKIKVLHKKYLSQHSVAMPKLFRKKSQYTKDALVLVYLFQGYPDTKAVSKDELTSFVRHYYPNTNDVQQARHLAAQSGWYILSGSRNDKSLNLKRGEYKLVTLEKPFPGFDREHRLSSISDWGAIKKQYNHRCATCGSREGEPHFHWPSVTTQLQQGHKNPNKPLTAGNIIPQCQMCNRADGKRWEYDDRGRVIKLADAKAARSFDFEVQKELYKMFYNEYKGKDPNDDE